MAETKTVNLNVETNLGSLKSQLKTAQKEVETLSEKFGATSEAATNAARKAAQLKDAIGDAKNLTDAFNPDAKFNALTNSLSGVASGFSAYQGAMGLIGVDSKELEATLLKVQSAMALSQGLQGLGEAKDSFIQLKAVIGQTAIGQRILTAAQVVGAAAMRVLNIVMAANPILLVVTAVGSLVAAFYLLTRSTDKNAEAQKELNRQNELSIRLMKQSQEEVDKYTSSLNTSSKNKIALAKAEGANSEEIFQLEKARLEEQIRYRKLIHDSGAKLTAEQYAQQKQDKFDLKILEAQHKTDLDKIEDEKTAKQIAENKKRIADNKAKLDKIAEDNKTEGEKHKQELIDNANALNEALAESDAARQKQKEDQAAADAKMRADGLEALKENARKQLANDKKLAEDKKIIQNQNIQAVQDTLSTIGNLAELFAGKSRKQQEQAFKIQKAANIASATIDTYRAVSSTIASTPGGPIIKGLAGAVVLSAGLLNIKKIASTKFDSGGTPTPEKTNMTNPSDQQGNVITPNFNIVGNNGTNQLQQLKQAPIQAYVVSGEISSQQSLDRNRLRNATL
jgi:hypothetical protein